MKTILYFSQKEHDLLKKKATEQGVSMSACLRELIEANPPLKNPAFNWSKKTEELKRIGNRIDRIAYNLNRTGFLDEREFKAAATQLDEAVTEIEGVLFKDERE